MSEPTRICPNCGEAVEGRPNKMYCDKVCKGQHNRSINAEHNSESLTSSGPIEPAPLRPSPTPRLVAEWDEEQEAAAEKVRLDQEQNLALHERFCALVREMLESADKTLTARRIKNLISDAARLSTAYAAHPFIKVPNTKVGDRLKALYDMHDTLQEAADEIANKMMWQSKETDFEIPKKWRKHLRELLIAD